MFVTLNRFIIVELTKLCIYNICQVGCRRGEGRKPRRKLPSIKAPTTVHQVPWPSKYKRRGEVNILRKFLLNDYLLFIWLLLQKEREAYEVIIEEGKLMYKQSQQLIDTSEGLKSDKWIFVLSTSKSLYVGKVRFHLFSFFLCLIFFSYKVYLHCWTKTYILCP